MSRQNQTDAPQRAAPRRAPEASDDAAHAQAGSQRPAAFDPSDPNPPAPPQPRPAKETDAGFGSFG